MALNFHNCMPQYKDQNEPKWLNGWLENFQAKYSIAKTKKHSKLGSANAINYNKEIKAIQLQLLQFALRDIYNYNKTGLFFKAVLDFLLTTKPLPRQKIKKDRITAMHTYSALGKRLKIQFIGKLKNPRCFKNIKVKVINMFWRNNQKAQINTNIIMEYLKWFNKQMAGS